MATKSISSTKVFALITPSAAPNNCLAISVPLSTPADKTWSKASLLIPAANNVSTNTPNSLALSACFCSSSKKLLPPSSALALKASAKLKVSVITVCTEVAKSSKLCLAVAKFSSAPLSASAISFSSAEAASLVRSASFLALSASLSKPLPVPVPSSSCLDLGRSLASSRSSASATGFILPLMASDLVPNVSKRPSKPSK